MIKCKKGLALLLTITALTGQCPAIARASTTQELTASYNADVAALTGVTPVENQADTGYCWAYMADAVLESYLLRQRQTTNDFSEQHMYRQLSFDAANPGYGFANLSSGASYHQAIGYWVRGVKNGPVQEGDYSQLPQDTYVSDTIELGSYVQEDAGQKAAYLKTIKQLVQNYGAVGVSIWFSPETQTLTTRNGAYYYNNGESRVNHGVTVVGWDDTYGVEHFYNQLSTPHQPSAPGAFLVKNSWGLDENSCYGTGYYWISYENYFQDAFAVRAVTSRAQLYDHIYETDYRGLSEYVVGSSYSNTYTLTASRQLTALATYVKAGASYQFSINGMAVQTVENTTVEDGGYRIFHLTSPVELPAGKVTVTAAVSGVAAAIPASADSSAATDTSNVCLKLFTKEPASAITAVSVSPQQATVPAGGTYIFSARAFGSSNPSQLVDWKVIGAQSANTIVVGQTLYVGADEKATQLYVVASARSNPAVSAVATVTVSGTVSLGSYIVSFYDDNGVLVKQQSVSYGGTATPPLLVRDGYTLSWSRRYTNVTSNLSIYAIWTQNISTNTAQSGSTLVSLTDKPVADNSSGASTDVSNHDSIGAGSTTDDVVTGTVNKGIYTANADGTATFTKNTNSGKKRSTIILPAKVSLGGKTYRVTTLAARCFRKNTKLRSITLGSQVERIGFAAFYGCKNLTKIKIRSEQVTSIGNRAFDSISSKAVIYVPRSCLSDYRAMVRASGSNARVRAYD